MLECREVYKPKPAFFALDGSVFRRQEVTFVGMAFVIKFLKLVCIDSRLTFVNNLHTFYYYRGDLNEEVADQPVHFPFAAPKLNPGRLYIKFGKPVITAGIILVLTNVLFPSGQHILSKCYGR